MPKPEKNIILISWDAVQRNHLIELIDAGKLPNLTVLRDSGRFIPLEISTHQTDTKAGHAQMLTGYKPETTGVYNNNRYDAIPAGLSIFDRIEAYFGDDAITTILLTGKSKNIGSMTPEERDNGKKLKKNLKNKEKANGQKKKIKKKKKADIPVTPEPWHLIRPNIDVWDGDISRSAAEVGPLSIKHIEQHASQSFFFFLHFGDPDRNGHDFGENSKEYEQGIILCDTWLGAMLHKLEDLGIADRTLIYVTTDHGFDEGGFHHRNAPHIWLVTNDTSITNVNGDQMDIVPTILKREGIDPESVKPSLPGKPLF